MYETKVENCKNIDLKVRKKKKHQYLLLLKKQHLARLVQGYSYSSTKFFFTLRTSSNDV